MDRRSFMYWGLCSGALSFRDWPTAEPSSTKPISKLSDDAVTRFRKSLRGPVYRDGDAAYDKLRAVWAAKVDQHPALIVHAANEDDVSSAVRFAHINQLGCAVRCGGHSYAGYGTCEGGLLLDMSGFRDMTIHPDLSSARLGGGLLSGAVEIETARVNRAAVFGQCPSVGIGGYLLGGGVGPLMSKYGLGCDNVLAANVVLANGDQVRASSTENPDLYWALRGGGGNFGVITAFEVALHPVSEVFAGSLILAGPEPGDLLKTFRDFARSIPDELTLIALMMPDKEGNLILAVQACYLGSAREGEQVLGPLRRSKLVVHDGVQSMRYLELEQKVPAVMPRAYNENRAGFLSDIDDQAIALLMSAAKSAPVSFQYWFIHLHGATARVPTNATAFPLRKTGYAIGITADWEPTTGSDKAAAWVSTVHRQLIDETQGTYVNVMDREPLSAVQHAYGSNYSRLSALKRRYDPQNLFRFNQNVLPAERA